MGEAATPLRPLAAVARLLRRLRAPGSFAARRTAKGDDLHIEVEGVGRLRLPVSTPQAVRLCRIARPAHYGQGTRTLLDRRVRDTCEVPRELVRIDEERWQRTLAPVLDDLAADLGLPAGDRLEAELHSLLVYAPGQHFRRHQDSERSDDMLGTLVVTLPGAFAGGELVVEHQGGRLVSRATARQLSFVAFYADCPHEVRPVKKGYRVVLTYDLARRGGAAGAAGEGPPAAEVETLAGHLRDHFATPSPRERWASQDEPARPPSRLVFLLDHQYTERGLGWHRLKGDDAVRVAALCAAAERAGCDTALALAEVQETWSAFEEGWDDPWGSSRRRWRRDEDDDWEAEEPIEDTPERYSLDDLIESSIVLDRWLAAGSDKAREVASAVDEEEACAVTPSVELEPYESEYEGYMGNYGNTMDRWYRRAALVVWPRELGFAVRSEASPGWALVALAERIEAGAVAEARELAESLLPFWERAAQGDGEAGAGRRDGLQKVLRVADGLASPRLAAALLAPYAVERLSAQAAPIFSTVAARYGEEWTRSVLSGWRAPKRRWSGVDRAEELAWTAAELPRVAEALRDAAPERGPQTGPQTGRLLLENRFAWLGGELEESGDDEPPSTRRLALAELAAPLLGWFQAAAALGADDLATDFVDFLTDGDDDDHELVPVLVATLRAAAGERLPPGPRPTGERLLPHLARARTAHGPQRPALPALDLLARRTADRLAARLAAPPRRPDDWTLELPPGCACEHCQRLAAFLADARAERLEWPLAKPGRRHVHDRLDRHQLPVRHQTRRTGSPFTLVLEKRPDLWEREAAERRGWEEDQGWLEGWGGGDSGGAA